VARSGFRAALAHNEVPIPDTTKLERPQEGLGAVNVDLTRDDLREIESATSEITVQGARANPSTSCG